MTLFDPPQPRRSPDESYSLYRGTPPHVHDSDTSLEAAQAARPSIAGMQARIFGLIAAEPAGMTCDEVEVETGYSHQSASARIRELVLLARIRDTGQRRLTRGNRRARVYAPTSGEPR